MFLSLVVLEYKISCSLCFTNLKKTKFDPWHQVFRRIKRTGRPRAEIVLGADFGTRKRAPQVITIITHTPYDESNAAFDATDFGKAFARATAAESPDLGELVVNKITGFFDKQNEKIKAKEQKRKEEEDKKKREEVANKIKEETKIKALKKIRQEQNQKTRLIKQAEAEARFKKQEKKKKLREENEKKELKKKADNEEETKRDEVSKTKSDKENMFIKNTEKAKAPKKTSKKKNVPQKKKKTLQGLYSGVKK